MLLYAIGALSEMLSWPNSTVLFASILYCIENALAAFLLWRCAKRLLPRTYNAWYVAFLVTLPVFVITSVVFASDALVLLPFAVYCISAIRLLEEHSIFRCHPSVAGCLHRTDYWWPRKIYCCQPRPSLGFAFYIDYSPAWLGHASEEWL